jgi:hypothetical protein
MARHKIVRAEVVVYTNEYGLPLRLPELHVDGEETVTLHNAQTVKAIVGPSDVSHVEVTFLATLRYEITESSPSRFTTFEEDSKP